MIGKETPLGGNERAAGLASWLFVSVFVGLNLTQSPDITYFYGGWGLVFLGISTFSAKLLKEWAFNGMDGETLDIDAQKNIQQRPKHYRFMIDGDMTTEIQTEDDLRQLGITMDMPTLDGMITEEERNLPALLQKALTTGGDIIPKHHFYLLKTLPDRGNYEGYMILILPSTKENTLKFWLYRHQMVGKYMRYKSIICTTQGSIRGNFLMRSRVQLNRLQAFLVKLHIKKYPKYFFHEYPVVYITGSPLHKMFPIVISMAGLVTKESLVQHASRALAILTEDKDLIIENQDQTIDSQYEIIEAKLDATYGYTPPDLQAISDRPSTKLKDPNIRSVVAIIAIVGIALFAFSIYTGEIQFGTPAIQRIVNCSTVNSLVQQGWKLEGQTPEGLCRVSIEASRVQVQQNVGK